MKAKHRKLKGSRIQVRRSAEAQTDDSTLSDVLRESVKKKVDG